MTRTGKRERPRPKHLFRDTAILYGVLSAAIVVVALATGGGVVKALVVAAAFFVVATGWSWWRFRERIAQGGGRR